MTSVIGFSPHPYTININISGIDCCGNGGGSSGGIASIVEISGPVTISSCPVSVTCGVTLSGPLTLSGITAINGTLPVTISGAITANPITISGLVNTSGYVTLNGPITISGAITANPITISGAITTNPITISGAITTNPITISGAITTNPITISGAITANPITISGAITANPITISGAITTNPITISGAITANPITISGISTIDGSIPVVIEDQIRVAGGDAFGRLRVSNPYTLFEFNSILGKKPLVFDEITTGTATSTWSSESYIGLAVNANGDSVIRQTREYIPYQPGKSKLVYLTGVLVENDATPNLTTRIGSFDASAGHFFQYQNGNISIVERTNGVDNVIPRSSWIDCFDGAGPSFISIDFTKAQIFVIDMEWLGVGQVRFGIVSRGELYVCYRISHQNSLLAPYFYTAKLPLRYEITSTGSVGAMRMICGTVLSEGGFVPFGANYSTGIYNGGYRLGNTSRFYPIKSISLRTNAPYNRGTLKLKNIDIFSPDSASFSWQLILNTTIGGAVTSTFSDFDITNNSITRTRTHAVDETITGGTIINSGFIAARTTIQFINSTDELISSHGLTSNIVGTPDIYTLAVQQVAGTNNPYVYAIINWIEIF